MNQKKFDVIEPNTYALPKAMTFSMACNYSGHTLLAYFLDSHSQLTHLGDTVIGKPFYRKKMCSCRVPTEECCFWQEVYAWDDFERLRSYFPRKRARSVIFSRPKFFFIQKVLVSLNPNLKKYAQTLLSFRSLICDLTKSAELIYGRKRIADALLLISCGLKVKIIHITKHPVDYVASCIYRQKQVAMFPGLTIEDFAKSWANYNSRIYSCQSLDSLCKYIHVKHQDLCNETEKTLTDVCQFLGVKFEKSMLEPEKFSHHIVGSKSIVKNVFQGIQTSNPHINLVTESDKEIIKKNTYSLANILGYL